MQTKYSLINTNSINNEQSLWVVSWGSVYNPPSTFVQLLLVGSDFCSGGRTPQAPWQIQHWSRLLAILIVIGDRRLATAWIHCAGSATYQVTDPEP